MLTKTNIENILLRKLIIISVVLKFFDCYNIFGKYEVIRLYSSFSGSDSDCVVNDDEFVSSSGLPDDNFEILAEESDNDQDSLATNALLAPDGVQYYTTDIESRLRHRGVIFYTKLVNNSDI